MNNKGYWLIDLFYIVLVLGIVFVFGFGVISARLYNGQTVSHLSVVSAIKNSLPTHVVRHKLGLSSSENPYPKRLDDVPANTPCSEENPCFSHVLNNPVKTGDWFKQSPNIYLYDSGGGGIAYSYEPSEGEFGQAAAP